MMLSLFTAILLQNFEGGDDDEDDQKEDDDLESESDDEDNKKPKPTLSTRHKCEKITMKMRVIYYDAFGTTE